MDIGNLIEAIGRSVSKAQHGVEQHSIERFFDYFTNKDMVMGASNDMDGSSSGFEPITARIVMPCSDDLSKTAPVDVPLVAFANHRNVHLSKVTVKVKTRLSTDSGGNVTADINAPVLNAANSPEDANAPSDSETSEIELVFNVSDSAEGLSRVVQNISKTI